MKRILFIAIPLLVALALLVTMVAAVSGFPVAAQNELDNYLRFLNRPAGQDEAPAYETVRMVRASRPWHLRSDLPYPTLGDSTVFQTDLRYSSPTPVLQTPVWNQYFFHNNDSRQIDDRLALPYPPRDLWCILLSDGTRDQIAFLALYHEEPYQTDWVVHQGPFNPFDRSFRATLADLGCDLGLEP